MKWTSRPTTWRLPQKTTICQKRWGVTKRLPSDILDSISIFWRDQSRRRIPKSMKIRWGLGCVPSKSNGYARLEITRLLQILWECRENSLESTILFAIMPQQKQNPWKLPWLALKTKTQPACRWYKKLRFSPVRTQSLWQPQQRKGQRNKEIGNGISKGRSRTRRRRRRAEEERAEKVEETDLEKTHGLENVYCAKL